jgi:hypothetical protein
MQVNVFVVGQNEGFVVAPCGAPLPGDEMDALGEVRFGWSVDSDHVVPKLDWMGIVKDIDARGYSIVPHGATTKPSFCPTTKTSTCMFDTCSCPCRKKLAAWWRWRR